MSHVVKDSIPDYFTKDYFKNVLEHGLRELNLHVESREIEKLNLGGENYCSNIFRVKINFFKNENADNIEKSLIIKSMPKEKQGALLALQIYLKETIFYLDIQPKLEALMWRAQEKPWTCGARHLFSTTSPDETLIFEDLCKIGYKLQSRQLGLDLEHTKMTLEKLAQYHALTMILAEMHPGTVVDRYPFGLINKATISAASFKELTAAQVFKLAELIESREGFEKIAKKLRNYIAYFEEKLSAAVYPMKGTINVLNHGDLWVNNLFFKYNALKKPTDVEFIDFQLSYYGSPGFDINYFLNTSVQVDILSSQRAVLIEIYYDALLSTLKKLPYRQTLPSLETLKNEINSREAYGLFAAIAFLPIMSMANLDSEDVSLQNLQNAEFVNKKIELMFLSNPRTLDTLVYLLKRADKLGILD